MYPALRRLPRFPQFHSAHHNNKLYRALIFRKALAVMFVVVNMGVNLDTGDASES
jgi:hypothetical protein